MRYRMLKRDIRLFLHCLLPAVAVAAVFTVVCAVAALAAVNGSSEVYTPVKAAVVDRDDTVFNRMLIHAVAKTDYITDLLEITYCDMDTAMEGIKTGDLAAVIVLPEGTFDAITSGENSKGEIYLSSSIASYSEIVRHVSNFGELLLASGQYGIFSGQLLIREHELEPQFQSQFLTDANALLLAEALEANSSYYNVQVLDYAGTAMSEEAYYLASWCTLLIMLLPLLFAKLYTNDLKKPILCRLKGHGIADHTFMLGKILYPLAFQTIVLSVLLCMTYSQISPTVSFSAIVCAITGVLVSSVICAFLMMLGYNGAAVLTVISLVGLLLCGGIIPRQMLPKVLPLIGAITPYGTVQSLVMPLWNGEMNRLSFLVAAVYVVLSSFAIRFRLQHIRIGGDDQ